MKFVTDGREMSSILANVDSMVDRHRRLPDQVLRAIPRYLTFLEWDTIEASSMWPEMVRLAEWYGEDAVVGCVVDPEPVGRFKAIGRYDVFSLSAQATEPEYNAWLNEGTETWPHDSIAVVATAVSFCLPRGGAAWWLDRDTEVGLLALYDTPQAQAPGELPRLPNRYLTSSEILAMVEPFHRPTIWPWFRATFLENYGSVSSPRLV
jgi:hypothetical protein